MSALTLNFHPRHKLPVILQTEAAECGLACLAMVAGYHGYQTDMVHLRRRFSISSHGTNLKQLMDMAAKLQLTGRGLQLELDEISKLATPCILHWDMNHFVVLKSTSSKSVTIHDPASGECQIPLSELGLHFTGVALELTPGDSFKEKSEKRRLKLTDLWQQARGIKRSLAQLILLSLVLQVFALAAPFFMQTVVDDVLLRSDSHLLWVLAIGFALLSLMNATTHTVRDWVVLKFSMSLNAQMAANLFRHLIRLPLDYFSKRHMGDVISRFESLTEVKDMLTTGVITAFVDGLMALLTLTMMFIYGPKLTLVVLGVVVVYGAFRRFLYHPLRLLSEESIVKHAKEQSNFMETLRAIQTVKVFQKENDRQNLWLNRLTDAMNTDIRIGRWQIGYSLFNHLLFGLENILVVALAAFAVMDGLMSVGMLFAFMSYKHQFIERMENLIDKYFEFKMLSVHLERLADIAFTPKDPAVDDQVITANPQFSSQLISNQRDLVVSDLSYQFGEAEAPVFQQLNFTIRAGESVAIIGPSGSGKTTLMKCLMGLLTPTAGNITLAGQSIFKHPDYRRQLGAVMQVDQLVSGSIAENIAFFDPQLDMERVTACAEAAAIFAEVLAMPMGLNTLVGDMGSSLSGGQKQRLLLARALYRQPNFLFLDEATSHLDTSNEALINQNIANLDITRIVIAHRQETIASCERVIDIRTLT